MADVKEITTQNGAHVFFEIKDGNTEHPTALAGINRDGTIILQEVNPGNSMSTQFKLDESNIGTLFAQRKDENTDNGKKTIEYEVVAKYPDGKTRITHFDHPTFDPAHPTSLPQSWDKITVAEAPGPDAVLASTQKFAADHPELAEKLRGQTLSFHFEDSDLSFDKAFNASVGTKPSGDRAQGK